MKKSKLIPVGLLAFAALSYGLHMTVESFAVQIKFGFLSKILLIVGIISCWIFWTDYLDVKIKNPKTEL